MTCRQTFTFNAIPVPTGIMPCSGCLGSEYLGQVSAEGVSPFTFSIISGALPDGLALDTNTGEISGTLTGLGQFTFTIRVTDALLATSDIEFIVYVITITSPDALTDFVIGDPYSHQLTGDGGSGTYVWAIASGSLPDGLTMTEGGLISGTPTEAAANATFTISMEDIACVPVGPLVDEEDAPMVDYDGGQMRDY